MVVAGSIEEYTLGAEEEDFDLPLEYFKDKKLFTQWFNEENAHDLYRLTREDIKELSGYPIMSHEDYEEDYSEIYRSHIVAMRQLRRELRKKRKQQAKETAPEKKAKAG